jgi:hypothetical protein
MSDLEGQDKMNGRDVMGCCGIEMQPFRAHFKNQVLLNRPRKMAKRVEASDLLRSF